MQGKRAIVILYRDVCSEWLDCLRMGKEEILSYSKLLKEYV